VDLVERIEETDDTHVCSLKDGSSITSPAAVNTKKRRASCECPP
jgi:hypothetical protein